jgi:putative ABC transport system permease protein
VALFGSVALGGARDSLLRGIGGVAHNFASGAHIWIISPRDNQATVAFLPDHYAEHIAGIPKVASVHLFQGSFFDWDDRRLWIIARPASSGPEIFMGQMIDGQADIAAARLREGGWIVLSEQIAKERRTGAGKTLVLPTPPGNVRFKIAATSTNFGWPTGVIFMNTVDYRRDWQAPGPTALGINLIPGANVQRVRNTIERKLGPDSGLEVLTAHTREARIDTSASEGLGQLGEISALLVLAAIFAMAAALGSNVWQRRASFAGLRIEGTRPARLRRVLLIEATLMLGAGCLTGALAGVYGQVVIDGYLKQVTGFPVASFATGRRPVEIFVLVVAIVLLVATIPGWFASRVSPTLVLNE